MKPKLKTPAGKAGDATEAIVSFLENFNTTAPDENGIFYPQTQADFEQVAFWIAEGYEPAEVFDFMRDESWRSRTTTLQAHTLCKTTLTTTRQSYTFCEECDQLIAKDFCSECGQASDSMPQMMHLLAPIPITTTLLKRTAAVLLRFYIAPETVLKALYALNDSFSVGNSPANLRTEDVDAIFNDAGAFEAERREQRGA